MDHVQTAWERIDRYSGNRRILSQPAITDARRTDGASVIELREYFSTMAALKGRRWYAEQILRFQKFPNRRAANAALLQVSRGLLEESRKRIVRTKNILAFHRPKDEYVN